MLQNAPTLAIGGLDTGENGPSKVRQVTNKSRHNIGTNYMWSFYYSMATMTTVGYGDITPTNTAEVVYTWALLWISLVAFSGCMGVIHRSLFDQGSM